MSAIDDAIDDIKLLLCGNHCRLFDALDGLSCRFIPYAVGCASIDYSIFLHEGCYCENRLTSDISRCL